MQRTLLVTLALVLMAAPSVFAAETAGRYTVGSPGFIGLQCNDGCSITNPNLLAGVNVGGVDFPLIVGTPVLATATDDSGTLVAINVCQDTDLDAVCGEAADPRIGQIAEPSAIGCGTVDLNGFAANKRTTTFVYSVAFVGGQLCAGTATTGTITLTLE